MPRNIRAPLLWLLLVALLLGCMACTSDTASDSTTGKPSSSEDTCTVYFMVDGEIFDTKIVPRGDTVSRPAEQPYKEDHFFLDWYLGETSQTPYNFSTPVTDDHVYLYAHFQVDTTKLTHKITTEHMSAIVTVGVEQYKPNIILWIDWGKDKSTRKASSGSGVVYKVTDSYVLILTNCHVAYNYSGYTYYEITVTDYRARPTTQSSTKARRNPTPPFRRITIWP